MANRLPELCAGVAESIAIASDEEGVSALDVVEAWADALHQAVDDGLEQAFERAYR